MSELPDLSTVPVDLEVPVATDSPPAPAIRSIQTTPGWEGTMVHHTLFLPEDWQSGRQYPVLVDYPGNGGYRNEFGDVSEGTVEGCCLGYGISGGRGFIWVGMPFVERSEGTLCNAANWWGDIGETKRYCVATVRELCARFGGDERRVVLCGFSRGSMACNYVGLHDDEIAGLWRAFICHSHYDGARSWSYPESDRDSARARLGRLRGRPQFITHEGTTAPIEEFLRWSGIKGNWTAEALPFRNHSAAWTLRDLPLRRKVRAWLGNVLK